VNEELKNKRDNCLIEEWEFYNFLWWEWRQL